MQNSIQSIWVLILSLLFLSFTLPADEGYEIKVKINGLQNEDIFLAYHYGDKQYMKDTTRLNEKGVGVFEGEETLPGGFYLIVLPDKTYFEVVVNEQKFSVENSTSNFINNFESSGSVENNIFYEDLRFINEQHRKKKALQGQLENAPKKEKAKIKEQLAQLDEAVKSHRQKIQQDYPNTFYAKFLKMMEEPEIPDPPKDEQGNVIDSNFAYKYYRKHYFDNIDLSDDRLLRTPVLHNKVMNYINKVTPQVPDSISKACDVVLQRAKSNDEMFQYWLVHLLNKYANSKIMGMDAVYVHLVENYYNTGDAYWVSEDDLYRIKDRAKSLKPTLLGQKAPNMHLRNTDNKLIPLHSVDAKYLMVFIYAPDCGHCKKQTPKFLNAYNKIVDTMGVDFKVYAAPTLHLHKGEYDDNKRPIFSDDPKDLNEWPDFIEKFGIEEWINVADLYLQDNFREEYDVNSTPKTYLLDKDKKIIAKRFNPEQLIQIIQDLEKRDQEGKHN